jgi:hypothetical protein
MLRPVDQVVVGLTECGPAMIAIVSRYGQKLPTVLNGILSDDGTERSG